jgi:hypothetical protein
MASVMASVIADRSAALDRCAVAHIGEPLLRRYGDYVSAAGPVPFIQLSVMWFMTDADDEHARVLPALRAACASPGDARLVPTLPMDGVPVFGNDIVLALKTDGVGALRLRVSAHPAHSGVQHAYVATRERQAAGAGAGDFALLSAPALGCVGPLLFADLASLLRAVKGLRRRLDAPRTPAPPCNSTI